MRRQLPNERLALNSQLGPRALDLWAQGPEHRENTFMVEHCKDKCMKAKNTRSVNENLPFFGSCQQTN